VTYPTDLPGRRERRATIRAQVLAEAEREISLQGRSMRCGRYDAHGSCRNDGSGCICECHDPA
jgi:hypothetical protein